MRMKVVHLLLVCVCAVAACAKRNETGATDSAAIPSAAPPVSSPISDVGKIVHVQVTTQGFGTTPATAVQEALRLAILEVNGESIDAGSVAVRYGLDVALGQTRESLGGSAFAEAIATRSKGAVSSFRLISLEERTASSQPYKADIEASIAKFSAPADSKKIRIVVSPLHVSGSDFNVGGTAVPTARIAEGVRQRLIDALTATGRFSVLDRDFGPEIQSELDLVAAGKTPSDEMVKLSQSLSADIVWVGTINDFGYRRNARHLNMSDRDLVTYSGGWSVSHRILNVSTRQIVLSETLHEQIAPTEPTTMDRGIDSVQLTAKMESEVIDKTMASILSDTFPILVVSKDGVNVILSQGGQAIKVGSKYAIVYLGKELKDPQTGASLGRAETPCCDVVVDRVSNRLAYGHLENAKIVLDSVDPVGLQVREELMSDNVAESPSLAGSVVPRIAPQSGAAHGVATAVRTQLPGVSKPSDNGNGSDDSKKW